MTDFNRKVTANADDGECEVGGSYFSNGYVYLSLGDRSGFNMHSFARFTSVTIPAGATIVSAIIRFVAQESSSGTTCNVNVHFEDADNAAAISSGSDLNGRPRTSAVGWNSLPVWTINNSYDTPPLAAILQDVIDRGGWASGNAITVHIRDNGSSTSGLRAPKSHNLSTADAAELRVTYETGELVDIADTASIADTVDVVSFTDDVADNFAIDDETIAGGGQVFVENSDDLTIDDSIIVQGPVPAEIDAEVALTFDIVTAGFLLENDLSDDFTVADSIVVGFEYQGPSQDDFTVSDLTDALNWSEFLKANYDLAVIRYYFTLTGEPDGTTDIEIPISSFQARKRSDYSTQLTVVIPDYIAWASAVTARTNGSMLIDMAYLVEGVEQLREQIIEVSLDDIRLDRGSRSRAITLTGSKVQNYGSQVVAIENEGYRYLVDGKLGYRFAVPDPWINPGDTCQVVDDEFVVDWVNYSISHRYRTMEVRGV